MARKITDEEIFKTNEEFVRLQRKNPLDEDQLQECKFVAFSKKNFDYSFQREVIKYHKINNEVEKHLAEEIYDYCLNNTKEKSIKFIISRR